MIRNQPHHLKQGEMAEAIAATFLQAKGLILLEKNFRCKHGEIDLIMLQGKVLSIYRSAATQQFALWRCSDEY
jgi:Holliday junction resolvase-like predicted endonuclease